MADKRNSPADTYEQAIQIREAWTNIGTANTYGDMQLAYLAASITALDEVEAKIRHLEDQLAAARDEHKDTRYVLWDKVKRARSGAKAKHGDNSRLARAVVDDWWHTCCVCLFLSNVSPRCRITFVQPTD